MLISIHIQIIIFTDRDLFRIRLGEHDVDVDDGTEVTIQAETIIKHPNFDPVTFDSDIALVKLRQPITYADFILPGKTYISCERKVVTNKLTQV